MPQTEKAWFALNSPKAHSETEELSVARHQGCHCRTKFTGAPAFRRSRSSGSWRSCTIAIEEAAKIVEMPVDELKALFPYQPSGRERHGMSFMLGADIDGHTTPLEFFTVYLLPDDPSALFNARVRKL